MATITMEDQEAVYYDPDGASTPLTIEFPDSTLLAEGFRVKVVNVTSSTTSITLTVNSGSSTDIIQDPRDLAAAPASSIGSFGVAWCRAEWVLLKSGPGSPNPYWLADVPTPN